MSSFRFIFDLNDYTDYLDLSKFQFYHAAISGFTLAIATDRHLILSDGVSDGTNRQDATIRVVLEFNEDSIRATTIAWITDEIIAVGFESGFIVCFNSLGEEIFEYKGNNSSVQSIRFSNADVNGKGPGVWILYELGYLISIPLSQVLKGKSDFFVAFKFAEHNALEDFVFCPTIHTPSIFDLDEDANNGASHSVLVSGMNSALSLYNLGGKLHFQDFDKLTGYAKEKVSTMLSKSFMSLFSSLTSSSSSNDAAKNRHDKSEDPQKMEEKAITLTSMQDFQDAKRRILRLSVEPFGTLVAAADSLGRVTLYDTRTNYIVRLWKGLRDARLSWTHSQESADESEDGENGGLSRTNSQSATSSDQLPESAAREVIHLHLVVYAPQLGLVSVYRMPHGACLRMVPVGLNGQLCTIMDETRSGLRVAKSFLIRSVANVTTQDGDEGGGGCSVEMIEMDPVLYSESDIDVNSASAIALLGGNDERGGDSNALDDDLLFNNNEGDEPAGRAVSRKSAEARLLQKLENAFTHLAEGHGSVARATAAAIAQNVEISGRAVDESLLVAAEQRVGELLEEARSFDANGSSRHQLTLRGVLRVAAMVESLELRGTIDCLTASDGPSVRTPAQGRSLTAFDGGRSICFSVQFHNKFSSLLNDVLNGSGDEENEPSVRAVVAAEIRLRARLLTAYEQLLEIHHNFEQSNNLHRETLGGTTAAAFSSPGSQVSPLGQQGDDAAVICRGNSSRAEALCWALRATKKAEKSVARQRVQRQADEKQLQSHSPKVVRTVSSLTAMHSLSPALPTATSNSLSGVTSPSGKVSLGAHAVRRPLVGLHSSPLNQSGLGTSSSPPRSSDPHLTHAVSSHAVILDGRQLWSSSGSLSFDCSSVSFSAFRAFHKQFLGCGLSQIENGEDQLDVDVFSAVKFCSQDLLQFVAAADRHFRPSAVKLVSHTVEQQSGTAIKHKNAALQSFISVVGNNQVSSPSLAAVKNRKFSPTPHVSFSSPQKSSCFSVSVESVACVDMLASSSNLINTSTVSQVAAAVSVPWSPPSMSLAYSLLQLLAAPLQGDLFAMNAFLAATKLMGASGPEGLRRLLPLHLSYLAHQPVGVLVSEVLTRKLSTSPLQRWLRDTLLTFQDTVSSYGGLVFDNLALRSRQSTSGVVADDQHDNHRSPSSTAGGNNLLFDLEAEEEDDEAGSATEAQTGIPSSAESRDASLSRGSSFSGGGGGEESDQLSALTREILCERARLRKKEEDCADKEADSSEEWGEEVPPSYDEFVRHILRPAWSFARDCNNLEATLAFAAVVLETLQTVHEQVERRTYGASGLSLTMGAWENLVRQVRVALLLSSRVGLGRDATAITVERLGSGSLSLHRLLAADTLCFAVRADQAVEHEERCQEVFNRRSSTSGSEQSDSASRSDVLLAWGRVADKRWRDLIAVAVAEDAIEGEVDKGSKEDRDSDEEGGTPQKKKRAPPVRRRRPLLLYFPRHSQQRFLGAYRSLILAERWSVKVHHVDGLALVSEHLFALPTNWRGAVAAEVYSTHILPLLQAFVALEEDKDAVSPSQQQQSEGAAASSGASEESAMKSQLLTIMADVALLKTFVRAAVEILRFVEICVRSSVREVSIGSIRAGSHPASDAVPAAVDPYEQEANESVWPGTNDKRMSELYAQFYWSASSEGDSDALALVREVVAPKWTANILQAHISVLWVMLLRFQCGLRGIRPSRVLGDLVVGSLQALDEQSNSRPFLLSGEGHSDPLVAADASSIRLEFLNQCLRRLIAVDPPVSVYRLAELWAVDLDAVRLLHITALLERAGALDDEVDLLVPQVADSGVVVDVITSALRTRLGGIVARIDRLAVFGPLLAAMDAEAVSWARKALPGDFAPDSSVLEDVARGRAKAVNINLASTRHLVISMQGMLLAVPVTERYGNGAGGGASSWLERKGKCDALLSLCNSFSHLSGGKASSKA